MMFQITEIFLMAFQISKPILMVFQIVLMMFQMKIFVFYSCLRICVQRRRQNATANKRTELHSLQNLRY